MDCNSLDENIFQANKVAIVTGASSGIGKAVAEVLASEGFDVALVARRIDLVNEGAKRARQVGVNALAVTCDVSDRRSVDDACKGIATELGPVGVLINNAGLNIPNRRLDQLDPEDWDKLMAVNLTGTYNFTHSVLPGMRKMGEGLIVNIASGAALQASAAAGAAYSASKAAVRSLAHNINLEEWENGIRASVINPGEVATEIMDQRPRVIRQSELDLMLRPDDVARAVMFVVGLPKRATIGDISIRPTVPFVP